MYLLILGIIPCADAESFTHEMKQEVIFSTQTHIPGDHHQEDACAPFCSCACCHINIDQPEVFQSAPLISPEKPISFFLLASAKDTPVSIWQPPKI